METGHDILFFWVARMVMLGTELTGQLPFKVFKGLILLKIISLFTLFVSITNLIKVVRLNQYLVYIGVNHSRAMVNMAFYPKL